MSGGDERTLNKLLNIPLQQRDGPQKEDFTYTDKEILNNKHGGVRIMIKDDFESVKNVAYRSNLYEKKMGGGAERNNNRLIDDLKKRQELLRKDYLSSLVNVERSPVSLAKSSKKRQMDGSLVKLEMKDGLKHKLLKEIEASKDSGSIEKHLKPIRKDMVSKISKRDVLIYKLLKNLKHSIFADPKIDPSTLFSKTFQEEVGKSQKKFSNINTKLTEYDTNRLKVSAYEKDFYKLQKAAYSAYLKGEPFDNKIINSDFLSYYLEKSQKNAMNTTPKITAKDAKDALREKEAQAASHTPARDLMSNLMGEFSKVLLRPQSEKRIKAESPKAGKENVFRRPKSKGHLQMTRKEQENRKKREEFNKQEIESRKMEMENDLHSLDKIEDDFMQEIYIKRQLFKKYSNIYLKDPEREYCQYKDLNLNNFRLFDPELSAQNSSNRRFSKGMTYMTSKKIEPKTSLLKTNTKDSKGNKRSVVEDQFTFDFVPGTTKSKEFYDSEVEQNRKVKTDELKKKFDRVHLTPKQEEFFKNIKLNALDLVKDQLLADPSLVNIIDPNHQTPLHWAAKRGLEEMVNLLLSKGADPFKVDFTGRTAKELASVNKNDKIISTIEALENFTKFTKSNSRSVFK